MGKHTIRFDGWRGFVFLALAIGAVGVVAVGMAQIAASLRIGS